MKDLFWMYIFIMCSTSLCFINVLCIFNKNFKHVCIFMCQLFLFVLERRVITEYVQLIYYTILYVWCRDHHLHIFSCKINGCKHSWKRAWHHVRFWVTFGKHNSFLTRKYLYDQNVLRYKFPYSMLFKALLAYVV
jgi:hypothetical protein